MQLTLPLRTEGLQRSLSPSVGDNKIRRDSSILKDRVITRNSHELEELPSIRELPFFSGPVRSQQDSCADLSVVFCTNMDKLDTKFEEIMKLLSKL